MRSLAASAKVKAFLLAVNHNGDWMDIRERACVGAPLRMADVVAEQRRLAAQVTLQVISPLDHESGLQ